MGCYSKFKKMITYGIVDLTTLSRNELTYDSCSREVFTSKWDHVWRLAAEMVKLVKIFKDNRLHARYRRKMRAHKQTLTREKSVNRIQHQERMESFGCQMREREKQLHLQGRPLVSTITTLLSGIAAEHLGQNYPPVWNSYLFLVESYCVYSTQSCRVSLCLHNMKWKL